MSTMDELLRLLDGFEHECYMLRVEASETRAKDEAVRDAYERIREESARAIAATLGFGECEKLPQTSDTVCVVRRNGFEMQFGYWRCSECGCENFEGAKHCMNCGRKAVKR